MSEPASGEPLPEAPEPVALARRAWLPVAITAAATLVIVGGWWSIHPSRFDAVGNRVGAHAEIGKPFVFSAEALPTGDVVLRNARARIRENSADAAVKVVFCVDTPSFGAYTGSAQEHCGRLVPISGAHLGTDLGSGRQLMVEVTLRRAGTVVIDGVDVTYRTGPRLGSEATGWIITVESR